MRVLIGSSAKGLDIANSIQETLDPMFYPTVWNQCTSQFTENRFDHLLTDLSTSDFGIFVLAPDDFKDMDNHTYLDSKANFLLGLFYGNLGSGRTFCLVPSNRETFPLFSAYNPIGYNSERFENLRAMCGPACSKVVSLIKQKGYREDPSHEVLLKLVSFFVRSTTIIVENYVEIVEAIAQQINIDNAPIKISRLFGTALVQEVEPNTKNHVLGASGDLDIREILSLNNVFDEVFANLRQDKPGNFNKFPLVIFEGKTLERVTEREYILLIPVTEHLLLTIHVHCTKLETDVDIKNLTNYLVTSNMIVIKIIRKLIERCEGCGKNTKAKMSS